MTQFESRNITMMMDLYEMTMAYGYFKENDTEKKVAFDVFYRSDPARSNPQSGSGLGLAITAKILERFGGSIRAEQETPKGLRILLTIPKKGAET